MQAFETNQERVGEECISHFSHGHPLFYYRSIDPHRHFDYPFCTACGEVISSYEVYVSCRRCSLTINLHKVCAEKPRELKHFFHPHKLTLLSEPPWTTGNDSCRCSACGENITRFIYGCSKCKFYLDLKCSSLIPYITSSSTNDQQLCHPHPLFLCKGDFNFTCGGCNTDAECEEGGDYLRVYVCLECNRLLHKSCGDLPQRIAHHPFHPDCTFILDTTLAPDEGETDSVCHFCGNFCRLYFKCSECSKKMDFSCASLTFPTNQNSQHIVVEKRGHPHPLIHCNSRHTHRYKMRCCNRPEEKDFCYCGICKTFLHKPCAELPRQIQHPFHPQHSLTLSDSLDHLRGKSFDCKACGWSDSRAFFYHCDLCEFSLQPNCASPLLYPMLYMSELHQHPLAYSVNMDLRTLRLMPYMFRTVQFGCIMCNIDTRFHSAAFRCLRCNFDIHDHCLPLLPPTVKTKWHRHPLTLTNDPIKDYPDEDEKADFYCDCCEEKRDLKAPTYYCAECHLISHVGCVMGEVMDYLLGKSTKVEELCNTKVIVIGEDSDHIPIGLRNEIATVCAELVEHKAKLEEYRKICETTSWKLEELNG